MRGGDAMVSAEENVRTLCSVFRNQVHPEPGLSVFESGNVSFGLYSTLIQFLNLSFFYCLFFLRLEPEIVGNTYLLGIQEKEGYGTNCSWGSNQG